MFAPDQYELIDFGRGRKLERFGPYLLDRPSPAAENAAPRNPSAWDSAAARFRRTQGQQGCWEPAGALPETWHVRHQALTFELAPNDTGHLGLFAEQAANWDWLDPVIRQAHANEGSTPLRVLNLFAYTGGSTLAAAASGAQVTHVDAAAVVVTRARRNAAASGLAEAPIRWIVDDVRKFVRRETNRGNRYDALILDPPGYGHGPKGKVWKLADDLPALVDDCAAILTDAAFVLATWHTADLEVADMKRHVARLVSRPVKHLQASEMTLSTRDGHTLNSGHAIRWSRDH